MIQPKLRLENLCDFVREGFPSSLILRKFERKAGREKRKRRKTVFSFPSLSHISLKLSEDEILNKSTVEAKSRNIV